MKKHLQTRGYIRSGGRTSAIVLQLLKRLFGEIAEELLAKIQALSLQQLEALVLVLLDFCAIADLEEWLNCKLTG
ncbi:DUF4351 domain-containing protein [Nostoc sp. LPT]|uniref:DUF4351 domain-containing protein n=1 Tax=Nostoc sp. LPT TaxID=2815387 RepID=UPI001D3ED9B8|nr:DUF4351 domain-containing protein [Nostoc sp. LPT]MBN4003008.1 DUF4351 domain-containing protein [Nostoc sp. LPT]